MFRCDQCTYVNAITVPRCRMCNRRNPHYDEVRDPEQAVEDQLIGGVPTAASTAASQQRRADDWQCTRCQNNNPNYAMSCERCRASRLLSLPINQHPRQQNGTTGTTNNANTNQSSPNNNQPSRLSRYLPSMPSISTGHPFRGADPWTCPSCNTVQQRQVIRCKNCGTINTERIANRAAAQSANQGYGGMGGMGGMPLFCSIM